MKTFQVRNSGFSIENTVILENAELKTMQITQILPMRKVTKTFCPESPIKWYISVV